jgi:hypothetical protein
MIKIAAFVGGVLLMAGVAVAGTMTSVGSDTGPSLGPASPPATTSTVRQQDRARENEVRGLQNEVRENEPGEDLRGPCDEAEHANDPGCTGAVTTPRGGGDDRGGHDDLGQAGRGDDSGPGSSSGHGNGDDSGNGGEDD